MEKTKEPIQYFRFIFLSCFVLITALLVACGEDPSDKPEKNQALSNTSIESIPSFSSALETHSTDKEAQSNPVTLPSTADWAHIKKAGILRIIVPYSYQHNNLLPRKTSSYNDELKLIIRFSEQNELTPVLVITKQFSNLLPSLEEGHGDIVVANLTVTESRKQRIQFTDPFTHAVEKLVVSDQFTNQAISKDKLGPISIAAREHTSFWETVKALKEKQPDIKLIKLEDNITPEEKYHSLLSGKVDAIIEDSNQLALILEYKSDIKATVNLGKERPIAWAVRKNNPDLLNRLNRFITTEKVLQHLPESRLGDLDTIKKNNQLRLITRNNAASYFLWKNQLMGFEYELIKEFAKQQNVNLKVLVADDYQQMLDWLKNGYGDIIASGLIQTEPRTKLPVLFTDPYLFVKETIIQRQDDKTIETHHDFNNRTFHVRKSSSYWNTLKQFQNQLKPQGIEFTIKPAQESLETEEIILSVLNGQFDLTLADSNIIDIEKSWHSDFQSSYSLTEEQGHRWLTRQTDTKLHSELNKFIKNEYKGLFYNITFNKYFKNSRNLFDAKKRLSNNQKISKYDDLIKSLSNEYHFDWRLIAAQINKESQFNPKAKSWAGAKGLLQVMPRTAKEVGISDLKNPENGLRAGIKYMAWIREQLSEELPADVKTWFTLAAYNAGLGHLKDARILARKQGLNPDRWFGHVEKAFLLLAKPAFHKQARYGYVRGSEPVAYVKQIQAMYKLYSKKHPDEA